MNTETRVPKTIVQGDYFATYQEGAWVAFHTPSGVCVDWENGPADKALAHDLLARVHRNATSP